MSTYEIPGSEIIIDSEGRVRLLSGLVGFWVPVTSPDGSAYVMGIHDMANVRNWTVQAVVPDEPEQSFTMDEFGNVTFKEK